MTEQGFYFSSPIMNAAGSLGFSPDPHGLNDLSAFGAFVTNPISPKSRKAARGTRLLPYPSGLLLHSGHPNPGLRTVLKKHRKRWARAGLPVIVHLLGSDPGEMQRMALQLEEIEIVMGIEVGFPHDIDIPTLQEMISGALGELPLMARLPMARALELAHPAMDAGASVISLGPQRGTLIDPQGKAVHGRLYGPGVFPQALEKVHSLADQKISVVGAGGIYENAQAQAMLEAGAVAVQVDTALWLGFSFSN